MKNRGADEKGVWAERLTSTSFMGCPCVFLDRDGVIVEERNFLCRTEDVTLTGGISAAIARANRAGVAVVMVTNQSGIARGLFGWGAFAEVQGSILTRLREGGAVLDMVLACAYHEEGKGCLCVANHPWRKPNPGMLIEAAHALGIDLARSTIVGDRLTDLHAGRAAGLRQGALVLTGYGSRDRARLKNEMERNTNFTVRVAPTAADAIDAWLQGLSPSGSRIS